MTRNLFRAVHQLHHARAATLAELTETRHFLQNFRPFSQYNPAIGVLLYSDRIHTAAHSPRMGLDCTPLKTRNATARCIQTKLLSTPMSLRLFVSHDERRCTRALSSVQENCEELCTQTALMPSAPRADNDRLDCASNSASSLYFEVEE
jgi:hypothetical protein